MEQAIIWNDRILCPVCGRVTDRRVRPDTRAENLPLWCKKCHRESIIKIEKSLNRPQEGSV